jgi:hypothetical protein
MKNLFTISWSDIPDMCVENFKNACGRHSENWASMPLLFDIDAYIRNNMNIELAKCHASEFTDNPWTEPVCYWDNLDFEDESYYTWFILRWGE